MFPFNRRFIVKMHKNPGAKFLYFAQKGLNKKPGRKESQDEIFIPKY